MFALGNDRDLDHSEIVVRSRHSGGRRSLTDTSSAAVPTRNIDMKRVSFDVPLPVSKRFRDVRFKTLVGISPLVPCAWYAVDDCLSLWRFRESSCETTIQCDGVITAVAIGVPAPMVFDAAVKFMVVIATENSVSLHCLDSEMKLILGSSGGYFLPTTPTMSQVITQASVTATGRVFLWSGSDPASLLELRYAAQATWFRSRIFFHKHSLILTSGASGIVASVFSKLFSGLLFSPPPKIAASEAAATGAAVKIFIHPESTFKFFVTVDSLNVSLHEISPSPSPMEISTASWRHRADSDITIRVVGRIALADLAPSNSGIRVVSANVCVPVDRGDEPIVNVVTDSGDLIVLRNSEIGRLVVLRGHQVATQPTVDDYVSKKQRTILSQQSGGGGTYSVGFESSGLVVAGQGTRVVVATSSGGGLSEFEANGSILSLCIERQVESDQYSSFILPALSAGEDLTAPGGPSGQTILILTGKGVTVLEPPSGPPASVALSPKTVQEVVSILSSKNQASIYSYKPMFVRAITDDVHVASLSEEQDYASRGDGGVRPLSGGVWIGGVKKFADALVYVLSRQPVFVSPSQVGPSGVVLESVSVEIRNLTKFVRQVITASGIDYSHVPPMTLGYKRREFIHGVMSREDVAKRQAVFTLGKIVEDLSVIGEVVGFFSVVAKYHPISTVSAVEPNWTLSDYIDHRPVLKSLCETLINSHSSQMSLIVESLRQVAPSILCSVSPTVVPFNAEGIAAMIHCAVAQKSPVHDLLEAVRCLGRNNPIISKTLSEVGQILRSLPLESDSESRECVIGATLDGLQERLIDESTVVTVLSWSGSALSASLNDFILSYLFEHGNYDHIAAGAAANSHVERFLMTRIGGDAVFGEVFSDVLERSGRPQQGADLLERIAFSAPSVIPLHHRIRLLEKSSKMFVSKKRFELLSVARHVQVPLVARLGTTNEYLGSNLLGIADLYDIAKEESVFDIILRCFMFVSVKDSDLIKAWANVLFSELTLFTKLDKNLSLGVVAFVEEIHDICVEIDSGTIWRKPELIAAMIEYLFLMVGGPRVASVADEILSRILRLSPQQVVEAYVKMLREINIWTTAIPRVRGGADLVLPPPETIKNHLVDVLVSFAQQRKEDMNPHKLQSLLILAKNYIQRPEDRLNRLIEQLGASSDKDGPAAALPTW